MAKKKKESVDEEVNLPSFDFSDSAEVVIKSNGKGGMKANKTYEVSGHTAKVLIKKDFAEFVEVVKPTKK